MVEVILLAWFIDGKGYVLQTIPCPDGKCTLTEWNKCEKAMNALTLIDMDVSCHLGHEPDKF